MVGSAHLVEILRVRPFPKQHFVEYYSHAPHVNLRKRHQLTFVPQAGKLTPQRHKLARALQRLKNSQQKIL